jgi:hypothetical protein
VCVLEVSIGANGLFLVPGFDNNCVAVSKAAD